MYYVLLYDYVDDILDRREPFRDGHLGLAREFADRGELLIAGALGIPVDGAALVFNVENKARIEEFIEKDPYAQNGLVTGWKIKEWTVVIGLD